MGKYELITGAGETAGEEGASVVYLLTARGSKKAPGASGLTTPWLGTPTDWTIGAMGARLKMRENKEAML